MERNFLIFIAILFIIKNIVTSTQYNNQEIILKIKEKGYQHILTTDPEKDKTYTCPDILYINEVENNKINKCGPIYLNEKNSTIRMIWYNKILYYRMFKDLVNITEVDLSNFDTSLYDNFNMMFQNCISLTSINFGNKERTSTLNENNLNSMFYNCKSLISINLSTFKKLKITSMGYVFFNCISLKYVNLSGIDTSNVKAMDNMFNNCTSLTSIDMSNLDTSSVTNMDSIFINCKNLEFINLKNDVFSKLETKENAFQGIKPNFVICIDPNSVLIRNNANKSCVTISCETNWKHYQKQNKSFYK